MRHSEKGGERLGRGGDGYCLERLSAHREGLLWIPFYIAFFLFNLRVVLGGFFIFFA